MVSATSMLGGTQICTWMLAGPVLVLQCCTPRNTPLVAVELFIHNGAVVAMPVPMPRHPLSSEVTQLGFLIPDLLVML